MANEGEGSREGKVQGTKRDEKLKRGGENVFPVSVVHKDVYHRLNFMYQANILLDNLGNQLTNTSRKGKERAVAQDELENGPKTLPGIRDLDCSRLARDSMKSSFETIAVHQTLRLDTSLKRSVCQACGTVLIPGMTARIRVRPSKTHQQTIHTTCLSCSSVASVPAPPFFQDEGSCTGEAGSLDGPVRAKRRRKARRKVPFNEREKKDGSVGHELWNRSGRVPGWGCAVAVETQSPPGGASRCSDKSIKAEPKAVKKTPAVDMTDEEAMMNL